MQFFNKLTINKKRQGSALLVIALALCIITSIIGAATANISNTMFSALYASQINAQANEYAQDKAELLKATNYDKVTTQSKTAVEEAASYFEQVDVVPNGHQKNITIKIFYKNETEPRATLELVRSLDTNTGCPVGTIIAWPSQVLPTENGVWLPCDGSFIPAQYSILRNLLHSNTTPNTTMGSFLRGFGSYDAQHSSGNLLERQKDTTLPMYGSFYTFPPQYIAHYGTTSTPWKSGTWNENNLRPSGTYTSGTKNYFATKFDRQDGLIHNNYTYRYAISFDNSRAIRTSKETRPLNVAVHFLIKAQ